MEARPVGAGSHRLIEWAHAAPRRMLAVRAALAMAAALGGLALAAPASAKTRTFNYTGAAQTWTVPAGVTQATFDLFGAQGGGNLGSSIFAPGLGGHPRRERPQHARRSIQACAV